MKPTLVIGVSTNPGRYAYLAVHRLRSHDHPVIAYGPQGGTVADVEIETEWNPDWKVDTVTLYVNPQRLEAYEDRILALKPKRVIFNPGTESPDFIRELQENGIAAETGCTLVMLSVGTY
jgi:uncharacterized protein